MVKKKYPKGKALTKMFLDKIRELPNVQILKESDVSLVKIDNDEYYLYFKCICHEGNPYPIEHQRAQLPKRASFEEVLSSPIPFLFLGYDTDNDVYVTWDPTMVKPRLNKKTYVSFYSRLSVQKSIVDGEIREERLTNGDKFVLFKSSNILSFFQMIDQHFPSLRKVEECYSASEPPIQYNQNPDQVKGKDVVGKIFDVNDDASVKLLIDSMEGESALTIISECMNEFSEFYPNMSLSEWNKTLQKYLNNK